MATDKLMTESQGNTIIEKLEAIKTNIANINQNLQVTTNDVTQLTGYSVASQPDDLSTGDSLNQALGKLQKQTQTNKNNISTLDSRTGFGTAIQNGTNINNMTTIGNYYISTYANAGTMTNLPVVRSGRLEVKPLNTSSNNRLVQIYYPTWNDAEIIGLYYMRQLPSNDGWSNWYEYGGTEIVPTP